ncbi:MAG: tetratricopeptide repeat protein [Prevotellaceae bacterium]|jgi:tetratricopeptide (TPR) repeat protein|nr:tetratricopeptide repeat protein [Prevotellaceae bacterium]
MTQKTVSLACPGCGAHVSTEQKKCEYCGGPVIIATFESVNSMSVADTNKYTIAYRKALAENPDNRELNASLAMCYLKLKLYDKAISAFENAIEDNFDNSEIFFDTAVSLLRGQKAFVAQRADIDKIIEYLNAAIMIEPKGIYHYFLAYVKYDYFHRKYLNISPGYIDEYDRAMEAGVSEDEIQGFFSVLGVERPDGM